MWASGDRTTTHLENVLVPRFRKKHYIQREEEAPSVPVLSEQLGPLHPLAQQTKEQRHTAGTKSRENGELTQRPGPAAQWGALKVLPLHCSPDPLRPFSPIPLKRSTKWIGAKPSRTHHSSTPGFSRPPSSLQKSRDQSQRSCAQAGRGCSVDTGPTARWPPPIPIPEAGSPTQAPRSGPL